MKNTFILLLTISTASLMAQEPLKADAGPDRNICYGTPYNADSVHIGGNPTASGGTPPYSYTWEYRYAYNIGPNNYIESASDIVNDSTLANPKVVRSFENSYTIKLIVKDAKGNIETDQVNLTRSDFLFHLGEWTHFINVGDSFYLIGENSIGTIHKPCTYLWRPNYGLTDSTSKNVWAKPTQGVTAYYQIATDPFGCTGVGSKADALKVIPTGVEQNLNEISIIDISYNNVSKELEWLNLPQAAKLTILNTQGQIVLAQTLSGDGFVEVSHLAAGVYIAQLTENGTPIQQLKFVVER